MMPLQTPSKSLLQPTQRSLNFRRHPNANPAVLTGANRMPQRSQTPTLSLPKHPTVQKKPEKRWRKPARKKQGNAHTRTSRRPHEASSWILPLSPLPVKLSKKSRRMAENRHGKTAGNPLKGRGTMENPRHKRQGHPYRKLSLLTSNNTVTRTEHAVRDGDSFPRKH